MGEFFGGPHTSACLPPGRAFHSYPWHWPNALYLKQTAAHTLTRRRNRYGIPNVRIHSLRNLKHFVQTASEDRFNNRLWSVSAIEKFNGLK
jgi:hypothetical protein